MTSEITGSRELMSEEDITLAENTIGTRFPETYRSFLLVHNGGHPKPDAFPIKDNPSDNHGLIQYFLCIKESDIYNLLTWVKRYKNRIPSEFLPIAVDPGGNLVCIAIKGNNVGKVYFWDHESEVEQGEIPGYKNVYFVAGSFTELLDNLVAL